MLIEVAESIAKAPKASISIPPAVAFISTAEVDVPAEFITTCCVPPPVASKVKLWPLPVTVRLEFKLPSIEILVPSIVTASEASISNVVEFISIGLSVPILIEVAESMVKAADASTSRLPVTVILELSPASIVTAPSALTSTKTVFISTSVVAFSSSSPSDTKSKTESSDWWM